MRSNTVMPLLRNDQFYCSALRAVVTLVVMADVMDVLWHNSDSSKVQQTAVNYMQDFSVQHLCCASEGYKSCSHSFTTDACLCSQFAVHSWNALLGV